MLISDAGITLIKSFEGCRLTAYQCAAGVWTIGYGHTLDVKEGQTITQEQAEAFLLSDLRRYEWYVHEDVDVDLTQGQYDALVSFTFNCGGGSLKTLIENRTLEEIADALLLYNKSATGEKLEGLVRRREAERKLFLGIEDEVEVENDMIVIHAYSLAKDGNKYLSKNFQVHEFKCKDGSDPIFIAPELVSILQKARDHFGKPLNINSAFRTASHNSKTKNAAKNSQHLYGTAADIWVSGVAPRDLYNFLETLLPNTGGLGLYVDFVHVDVRRIKGRWNG